MHTGGVIQLWPLPFLCLRWALCLSEALALPNAACLPHCHEFATASIGRYHSVCLALSGAVLHSSGWPRIRKWSNSEPEHRRPEGLERRTHVCLEPERRLATLSQTRAYHEVHSWRQVTRRHLHFAAMTYPKGGLALGLASKGEISTAGLGS